MDYSDQFSSQHDAADDHFLSTESESIGSRVESQEEEVAGTRLGAFIYEIAETILLAIVIWLVVNFATARYVVEGQSMEPNLHTGQFLIVSRLSYLQLGNLAQLGQPQRGDIVVFDFPGNPSDDYVKRIVGLPGERVMIDDSGHVLINHQPIEEPYLTEAQTVPYRGRVGSWTVPPDSYFVLGDNRNSSSDSRSWGPLEDTYVVGKAWVSYWPPRHWGIIPHYDYVTAP